MTGLLRAVAVAVGLLAGATSCAADDGEPDRAAPDELQIVERADWAATFDEFDVNGTFALHEVGTDRVLVHDAERASEPMLPASTFKVLNSLIALETGVVADVDELVVWDGVDRAFPEWNRDHSLRTGIEVSAVWAYQELARAIGPERMAEAVRAADYGNADIGGPIDEFWLRGDLRISALEQLDVLDRLLGADLPFEDRHQAAVREILVRERGAGWIWGHKTGTVVATDPPVGWLVGFTEYDGSAWVFAMHLDLGEGGRGEVVDPQVRTTLSRTILEAEGALPGA